MSEAQVFARQRIRDLAAHVVACGVEDERQRRIQGRGMEILPLGHHGNKRFFEDRVHFGPFGRHADVGGDDQIKRARFQLFVQTVAGPGFQQELAARPFEPKIR